MIEKLKRILKALWIIACIYSLSNHLLHGKYTGEASVEFVVTMQILAFPIGFIVLPATRLFFHLFPQSVEVSYFGGACSVYYCGFHLQLLVTCNGLF